MGRALGIVKGRPSVFLVEEDGHTEERGVDACKLDAVRAHGRDSATAEAKPLRRPSLTLSPRIATSQLSGS